MTSLPKASMSRTACLHHEPNTVYYSVRTTPICGSPQKAMSWDWPIIHVSISLPKKENTGID